MYNLENIEIFTLENANEMKVEILNLGGIIRSIKSPSGKEILKTFENLEDYINDETRMCRLLGRFAGLIKGATVNINDIEYKLDKNSGEDCLNSGFSHVGLKRFNIKQSANKLQTFCSVYDMWDNFPGDLDVEIVYTLSDDNSLAIEYNVCTLKDTLINLTHNFVLCESFKKQNDDEFSKGNICVKIDTNFEEIYINENIFIPKMKDGIENNILKKLDMWQKKTILRIKEV